VKIFQQKTNNPGKGSRSISLTARVLLAILLGTSLGAYLAHYYPGSNLPDFFKPFSDLFLRLIKMVIAPLVFSTLVAGIAGAGPSRQVGRMGVIALLYFEIITIVALGLGLLMVNLVRPGQGVSMPEGQVVAIPPPQTYEQMFLHVVPTSVIQSMAEGDVLQIVVFSIFFGLALSALKERAAPVVAFFDIIAETMFRLTNMVMLYAPIGVAAAMAYTVGKSGLEVLLNLAWLVGTLYVSLIIFVVFVLFPLAAAFGLPVGRLIRLLYQPTVIAFSTTSSEAALPLAMENLERLGVPRRIVSFIMPLGYSFNLGGTTLYLALAAVFIAQAAQIELPIKQQLAMMLTLMITSKGVAAVPRASAIILAGTLSSYGLPMQGLTMIFAVDTLMDMGRSAVNVLGNCIATLIIAKWGGEYHPKIIAPNEDID
jgi:proton glutamate symport protein